MGRGKRADNDLQNEKDGAPKTQTPAEYFLKVKDQQQQALKILGHPVPPISKN